MAGWEICRNRSATLATDAGVKMGYPALGVHLTPAGCHAGFVSKELCHEIYRNSEGTATRLSETLKQPLKKLKEDVTNIANTKGRTDRRT